MSARVAVVTGAGSGVGRSIARALLDEGYRVVLAGRRLDALEQTAARQRTGAGAQALAHATDVTEEASVRRLFELTRERFGRIDVLVNNAGTFGVTAPIDELDHEDWRSVLATNLDGAFLCAREAFRAMKEQQPRGGRIINNGSLSAQVARPHAAAYTVSKHGITGLTRTLALEGRPFDIACGQIDIGNATSAMTAVMSSGVPQADGSVRVEPTIDPAHVARAVVYMASLPLDANVLSMTVMATGMPFVGRG